MRNTWRWTLGPLVCLVAFGSLFAIPAAESWSVCIRSLVVMVVFDQMRGDYLHRDGSRSLATAASSGCKAKRLVHELPHYPYAYTLTAPGHTSLSTGTTPSVHGIIANDWYDRATAENATSATPAARGEDEQVSGRTGRKAESVGDVLLPRVLMGRGGVASLSIK